MTVTSSSVTCSAPNATSIHAQLGDGNDTATVFHCAPASLFGSGGNDTLNGGSGGDTFVGGTGSDVYNGNGGVDSADYYDRIQPLTITLDGTANDGESGETDNVKADVENVVGGSAADTITGNSSANNIDAGLGNNTIDGGSGNDTLAADAGTDDIHGGLGTDDW